MRSRRKRFRSNKTFFFKRTKEKSEQENGFTSAIKTMKVKMPNLSMEYNKIIFISYVRTNKTHVIVESIFCDNIK